MASRTSTYRGTEARRVKSAFIRQAALLVPIHGEYVSLPATPVCGDGVAGTRVLLADNGDVIRSTRVAAVGRNVPRPDPDVRYTEREAGDEVCAEPAASRGRRLVVASSRIGRIRCARRDAA